MLQKNKLTPFSFALTSIFITILLFIVFGSNGWGPAAANEQAIGEISRWCERVSGGFFREPANTLGNLGFVFVGLYMFYKLSKDATSNHSPLFGSFKIALLYASASTFLGPASMAMHGTHTQFGAWLDNVSMISYILILWIYNLKKLTKFSDRSFFISYSVLLGYYAYSYWFFDSGLGIGVDLFELSIGLWIATEVLVKLPNIYGRMLSGLTVLLTQQLFGSSVIDSFQNLQENWEMLLYFIPALIPSLHNDVERKYTPWFFVGVASFFGALMIWETGVPDHPWCEPDSWLQAHMVWHLLCAAATLSFFNFFRTERTITV
ncbi:MAG: ceramidase domain-containing protein [Candidatus Actinomarina sp.]|nr:ceramidase domain-containing protein [Candidatus Actinomarina sp.]MBL6837271.1 ceramidase domain-containing protein [Candidatus Actinomarina sp.]